MKRPFKVALASVLTLLAVGCAGYKLGPTGGSVAGSKSVRVNFFQNETEEPRLSTYVNNSLRKLIQQDGTYRLATRGEADIVVDGRIIGYGRSPLTYQPGDVITARDYRVSLTAHVTAIDSITGKTVLDREVHGRTTVRVGTDLTSADRQAAPLLAEDLARNTTALLVDGSW